MELPVQHFDVVMRGPDGRVVTVTRIPVLGGTDSDVVRAAPHWYPYDSSLEGPQSLQRAEVLSWTQSDPNGGFGGNRSRVRSRPAAHVPWLLTARRCPGGYRAAPAPGSASQAGGLQISEAASLPLEAGVRIQPWPVAAAIGLLAQSAATQPGRPVIVITVYDGRHIV